MSDSPRRNLWDKFWHDERGRRVIFQRPNIWIVGWAGLAVFSRLISDGPLSEVASVGATAFLVVWALLEVFQGVNYFRRGLGAAVLLFIIASRFIIS